MKIVCDRFGKHHCQAVEDLDENDNATWCEKHSCEVIDKPEVVGPREIAGNSGTQLIVRNGQKKSYKKNIKIRAPSIKPESGSVHMKSNGTVKFRLTNARTDTKTEQGITMHRYGVHFAMYKSRRIRIIVFYMYIRSTRRGNFLASNLSISNSLV